MDQAEKNDGGSTPLATTENENTNDKNMKTTGANDDNTRVDAASAGTGAEVDEHKFDEHGTKAEGDDITMGSQRTKAEGDIASGSQTKHDDKKTKREETSEGGRRTETGRAHSDSSSHWPQTSMDNVPYEHEGLARVQRMLWQLQNK